MMSREDAAELADAVSSFNKGSLRPTTTVVRGIPVVGMESWWGEEAVTPSAVPETDDAADADAGAGAGGGGGAPVPTIADEADSAEAVHGWKFASSGWAPAPIVTRCDEEARPGYATKKASEYMDTPEVLAAKARALAALIREHSPTVAYAGAGLSTASGISDYASKSKASKALHSGRPKLRTPLEARPTLAHRVLAHLSRMPHPTTAGGEALSYLIQQNHDGLPEKAGMCPSKINPIHGDWWSPANPVVPMSGSLRTDLFEDLLAWEEKASVVLACGTSMCGMNADRVAVSAAERAMAGDGGGLVIISLQATQYDHMATLRIFGTLDDVFMAVAEELGFKADVIAAARAPRDYMPPAGLSSTPDVFTVPYSSRTGKLDPSGRTSVLDLREGQKVIITDGPHAGDEGEMLSKNRDGHYRVLCMHSKTRKGEKRGRPVPVQRMLGSWWTEAAVNGTVPVLPVVSKTRKGAGAGRT